MSCHPTTTTRTTASVLLVGNPNVGKSTLFNCLARARQHVTNAPGTTVELNVGTWRDVGREVMDLPGTYSLVASSPEERVVCEALAGAPDAVAVVLVDATALSRSLYLLGQVARDGRPVLVGATMLDVARDRSAEPDLDHLARLLGVPVVALDPRTGNGLRELAAALPQARPVSGLPRAGDPEPLFSWVEQVVGALAPPPAVRSTRTDRVDRALLNPWVGLPVLLATMWVMFQLTTSVATPVMDLVTNLMAALSEGVRGLVAPAGSWVEGLLVDGVLAGVGTVATLLPLLGLVYLGLALLEDSGYLARAAFMADRLMRVIGLDGRAMLPLMVGFGCNVPALAATRTLPNARQRLLTGLLVPWTTCGARLTVYVLLAGVFFPEHAGTAIFGMYVLSVLLVAGGGLVLRRTAFRDLRREPLLLVLPAYQRPRVRALLLSVWLRVQAFAVKAGRIIVATLVLLWLLMSVPATPGNQFGQVPVSESLYGASAEAIAPVFAPAGFDDWRLTAALASGFVAKEVVVGSLAQSYAVTEEGSLQASLTRTLTETSGGHPAAAALAFMVFVLGYTPCLATVAEQRRLLGRRWTLLSIGTQLAVAWLLAVVVFNVGRLL